MTSSILKDWLKIKSDRGWNPIRESIEVKKKYLKITGGRCLFGVVCLSATPEKEFSFKSEVSWPDDVNYNNAVFEGLLDVLITENFKPVLGVAIKFTAIEWHDVDSCYFAYYEAAREAAREIISHGEPAGNINHEILYK